MDFLKMRSIMKDIKSKAKFSSLDHSDKYMLDLQFRVIKQRCVICGELYDIYDRRVAAFIALKSDLLLTLCPKCAIPYHEKSWTERQIEAAVRDLKKARRNLDSFLEVDPND